MFFFPLGDLYELKETESNEPSVKMTNFSSISHEFDDK